MQLCDIVRETGYTIHCYHKHGHLEKVYENALAHRLRKLGLEVKQQHPLKVYDEDGTVLGDYYADLLVDNRLIIELKAVKAHLKLVAEVWTRRYEISSFPFLRLLRFFAAKDFQ